MPASPDPELDPATAPHRAASPPRVAALPGWLAALPVRLAGLPIRLAGLPGWLPGLALVGLATLACLLLDGLVPEAGFGMVYLSAIVATAAFFGPAAAALATLAGFLAWNFLFLPPRYTLTIASAQDVLGAVVFAAVAALLAGTTGRLGSRLREARQRMAAMRRIIALARRLSGQASLEALRQSVADEASAMLGAPACLLLPGPEGLVAGAVAPQGAWPDSHAMAAARLALTRGEPTGLGSDTLPGMAWRFVPLRAAGATLGVLALRGLPDGEVALAIDALADQAAIALERAGLSEAAGQNRALAEAAALRSTLLASLGHDLRTPLTVIRGAAETLRSAGPNLPDATRADLLISIEEETRALSAWVSAVLELVRLEAGQVAPRREVVDLSLALLDAAATAERRHPGRVIWRDLPGALPCPGLDAALLDRVLENLLNNALLHTPPQAMVRVHAQRAQGVARLLVEDDGPGIPPTDLPRIFDAFFRAERTGAMAAGSGLGLAICRGLVGAMGGSIRAESPAGGGRGTRIVIEFPA